MNLSYSLGVFINRALVCLDYVVVYLMLGRGNTRGVGSWPSKVSVLQGLPSVKLGACFLNYLTLPHLSAVQRRDHSACLL